RERANPAVSPHSATDHAQGGNALWNELEDRGGVGGEVAVQIRPLIPHIAAREARKSAHLPRSVEPPQAGQPERRGMAPKQQRRVRGPGDRGKARRDGVRASFLSQLSQGRRLSGIHRLGQRVGTYTISQKNYNGHGGPA